MYCPLCNKEGVDFNSVAVNGPKRAYTLDSDGPIDPTYISNSSTVVNVCKTCGCQNLFSSKLDFYATEEESEKSDFRWKALCIVSGVAGLFGGVYFAYLAGEEKANAGSAMANVVMVESFFLGLLVVGIGTFIAGALILYLLEQTFS